MSKEELLQMLQEKGLSDDDIKALLKDALDVLDKDYEEHDKKEEEEVEDDEKKMKEVFGI